MHRQLVYIKYQVLIIKNGEKIIDESFDNQGINNPLEITIPEEEELRNMYSQTTLGNLCNPKLYENPSTKSLMTKRLWNLLTTDTKIQLNENIT